MSKRLTSIERAIAQLQDEIKIREHAIAALRAQQNTAPQTQVLGALDYDERKERGPA
jgi:hypothetical protein